jgi:hypothetical protein
MATFNRRRKHISTIVLEVEVLVQIKVEVNTDVILPSVANVFKYITDILYPSVENSVLVRNIAMWQNFFFAH